VSLVAMNASRCKLRRSRVTIVHEGGKVLSIPLYLYGRDAYEALERIIGI
jgi:hypothetical protein